MSAVFGFLICSILLILFTLFLLVDAGAEAAVMFWVFIFGMVAFCYGVKLMGF